MAIINAGALRSLGNDRYEMATDSVAFFTMTWHGAHPDTGGSGGDAGIHASIDIADTVAHGQFDLYFCSTACLRQFLNDCVDALEARIESARTRCRSGEGNA